MADYIFPHPCKSDSTGRDYADNKNGILNYIKKIQEELIEAQVAYSIGDIDSFAQELQDVITVCTSCQNAIGYDFNKRQILTKIVNEKNRVRGYF